MERPLRTTQDPARARDWGVALASARISSRLSEEAGRYVLAVAEPDLERAGEVLRAFDEENSVARSPGPAVMAPVPAGAGAALNSALATTVAMVAFYAVTGPRSAGSAWFVVGSSDAERIWAGEWWRVVTALTLHADLPHLIGNAFFGTFFLAALGRQLGPGLALCAAVGAGAAGNLANALLRSGGHLSVGASTAVFGALGTLAGLAAVDRQRRAAGWRGAPAPIAAALGLLALLGVAGERVDLWAHLLGLAAGVASGALLRATTTHALGGLGQLALAAAAAAALVGCWQRALA